MTEHAPACANDLARDYSIVSKKPETIRRDRLAYTVNDACQLLSVSRSHLYVMSGKGLIRLTRLGCRTLVPAAEINRLLGLGEAA